MKDKQARILAERICSALDFGCDSDEGNLYSRTNDIPHRVFMTEIEITKIDWVIKKLNALVEALGYEFDLEEAQPEKIIAKKIKK